MSSRYLEHFLDSVETLPYDLQRNFTLMRELDGYSQETIQSIARRTEDFFKSITELSNPERQSQLKTLRDDFEKCLEYGDDKVELAMQTYEMVDKHIRRLDSDLHKFEAELAQASDGGLIPDDQLPDGGAQKRKALRELESSRHSKQARNGANGGANGGGFGSPGAPGNGSTGGGAGGSSSAAGGGAQQRGGRGQQPQQSGGGSSKGAQRGKGKPDHLMDMPVDPNEPTYCTCHQVSYGEMICCDNTECPTEWFHFGCVNLQAKPKGKWFCDDCSKKQ